MAKSCLLITMAACVFPASSFLPLDSPTIRLPITTVEHNKEFLPTEVFDRQESAGVLYTPTPP
ncbi:hypothetical protein SNOG_12895 [Parastagonospora nodorum SN15]|uniref:Uncharacterized protein n=1 Tax=Phaeosphaeria nodorum (strain SN15 / ATCC MYA-4574 / FGSC 10173) TaxID=321614 RepID=Q0U5R9_PHANO|nr:hypothetical protein SNOG_12895 [Parastagonospora nodorum SN15]EAT79695.1 hypothetical protein SNOG_12895 [Parastagonospora nodorum SN15]